MPIEKWSDDVVIAHLADEPQFTDDMEAVDVAAGPNGVDAVLNFASVRFINSSNLARLLKLRKQIIGADRRLLLCGVGTHVWGAFLVTGLDKVFEFTPNVPTALATLQMGISTTDADDEDVKT